MVGRKCRIGLLLLLVSMLSLTGCDVTVSDTTKQNDAKELYTIYRNGQDGWLEEGVVSDDGSLLLPMSSYARWILRDSFSQEPVYIQVSVPGNNDETTQEPTHYNIYDTQGNLLQENSEEHFSQVFGNYAVVQKGVSWAEETNSRVVNRQTGQLVYDGVSYVITSSEQALVLCLDAQEAILLAKDGAEVCRFHGITSAYFANTDKGAPICVQNTAGQWALYSTSGQEIQAYEDGYYSGVIGDYCIRENERDQVYCWRTGEILWECADDVVYYDGITGIIRQLNLEQTEDAPTTLEYLTNAQGEKVSDPYRYISYTSDGSGAASNYFIAYDAVNSDQAVVLNQQGQIIFQKEASNLWLDDLGGGRFAFSWVDGNQTFSALLDEKGNVLGEENKYQYISAAYSDKGRTEGYYLGVFQTPQNVELCDILDAEGQVVVDNLKQPVFCDGKYIVASRGFSYGLLDMTGQWVYEASQFDHWSNE